MQKSPPQKTVSLLCSDYARTHMDVTLLLLEPLLQDPESITTIPH